MNIGIDQITFYIPKTYLSLESLSNKYKIPYDKFKIGLMQEKMAVLSSNQDIITQALNASLNLITDNNRHLIGMVIFATESSLDYAKSSSIYIAHLLGLNVDTSLLEVKQACFGITQALEIAENYVYLNSNKQVLIIGSDSSIYEPGSKAEPTGGAGAVSLIVSSNPRLLIFNNDSIKHSKNTYDFYRPTGSKYPIVDGHFANQMYEEMFDHVFNQFKQSSIEKLINLKAVCMHVPYSKLPLKIVNKNFNQNIAKIFLNQLKYHREIGNIYNGSLYLNLISLLDMKVLKENDLIALFSYGSGATASFMTMRVVDGYQNHLFTNDHINLINNRVELTYSEYLKIINNKNSIDYMDGPFYIAGKSKKLIKDYQRR